jgi:steroid 5-alpha reductase family enzyme
MMAALFIGWAVLALVFALGWRWSVRHENAGIVDVLWSLTLGALVAGLAVSLPGDPWRRVLLALATGGWALRLGLHILRRMRREAEEDARYRHLRNHWGPRANGRFFFFFQGQALANVLLAAPVALLLTNPRPLSFWDGAAFLLILGAVAGEGLADRQLASWRADPGNRGRTCRNGLWAWSRHPNYFFEWLHWLAYPLAGIALWGTPLGPWWPLTLLGPGVMLLLLLRATGIPYTEQQALRSRGDDYRRYQREVSAFIPWFPRKTSS